MATILITGVGFIGKQLAYRLKEEGHVVRFLSRNSDQRLAWEIYKWNIPERSIDMNAFENVDFIIHLAGADISSKRWTPSRKKEIIESRVQSTLLLYETVVRHKIPLKGFIGVSAIGYYGAITSKTVFTENDAPHNDFPSNVCKQWETLLLKFESLHIRTVILRSGVVLSSTDGAFLKLSDPIKKGFGTIIGNGKQYMPWIHIDDLYGIFSFAINTSNFEGIFNAVAPEHITNSALTREIAKKLRKKLWLPNAPGFILKLIFGQRSDLFLHGSAVSSDKIFKTGFHFKYTTIDKALNNLLS